jgi:hypothetical protein
VKTTAEPARTRICCLLLAPRHKAHTPVHATLPTIRTASMYLSTLPWLGSTGGHNSITSDLCNVCRYVVPEPRLRRISKGNVIAARKGANFGSRAITSRCVDRTHFVHAARLLQHFGVECCASELAMCPFFRCHIVPTRTAYQLQICRSKMLRVHFKVLM